MIIGTLNVRTLKSNDRLDELETAFNNSKIQILGLSETRRPKENMLITKKKNAFFHSDSTNGQKGVGFLIKPALKKEIIEIRSVNDRIAKLSIKLNKKLQMVIIQVYSPTSTSTESEMEEFYDNLTEAITPCMNKNNTKLIVMGDFNSQIGQRELDESDYLGNYGYGRRNARGWRLLRFCQENSLKITNTFFKKQSSLRWTWISPNLEYKNQIDYILVPTNFQKITDFNVQKNFPFTTDHRLIQCNISLTKERKFYARKPKKIKIENNPSLYENFISKILITQEDDVERSTDEEYEKLKNSIRTALNKYEENTKTQKLSTDHKYKKEMNLLHKTRTNLLHKKNKTSQEKIEINLLNKLIRRKTRDNRNEKTNKIIQEILDKTKSTKKINRQLSIGTRLTTYLTDNKNQKIYDRSSINKHATEYYANLYTTEEENRLQNVNVNLQVEIEKEPDFIESEIRTIVQNLKNNKAPGHDQINNESVRYGGRPMIKKLTQLFNKILKEQKVPKDWKLSDIILIHKKGDKHKIENYRPISLSPTIAKIFSKAIEQRIRAKLIEQQPREQAGFRKSFSTIDHLQVINQLIEKCTEFRLDVHLLLIDYSKAFDSIKQKFLINSLIYQGISEHFINIISDMYTDMKSRIITDQIGPYFDINKGVRQGDPLSPIMFNCLLEQIFKSLEWQEIGINIHGEFLNNLRFADDIILIAKNIDHIKQMTTELHEKAKLAGLMINPEKTKLISSNFQDDHLIVNGKKIQRVNEAVYLGQVTSLEGRTEKEVNRRLTLSWNKFWKLKHIFKGPFKNEIKSEIFNSCVIPTLLYGAQTWSLSANQERKIKTTQNKMERSILSVRKMERIPMKTIKAKLWKNLDAIIAIRRSKWKWAGHIARLRDERWTYKLTFWQPYQKRERGRQKIRWREEIDRFLRNNLFHRVALERIEWTRLREAFAHRQGMER